MPYSAILFLFLSMNCAAQNWSRLSDFPGSGRDDAVAFVIGSSAYVGTGRDVNFACTQDFWRYNFSTSSWSVAVSLPAEPRQYSSTFVLNGKGYLIGGITCDNTSLRDVWEYDPQNDAWSKKNDFPGSERYRALVVQSDEDVWLFGGRSGSAALSDSWIYNQLEDSWNSGGDLPMGQRYDLVGYFQYNKIYVGLGTDAGFSTVKDWWEFDPENTHWRQRTDYPGKNSLYTSALSTATRSIVCTGGTIQNNMFQEAYEFNSLDNSWKNAAIIPGAAFRGAAAFVHENDFYLVCGIDSNFTRLKSMWTLSLPTSASDGLLVFPNPVSNQLAIHLVEGSLTSQISISNTLGQLVYEAKGVNFPVVVDVSFLNTGLYNIKVGEKNSRFVKD